MGSTKEPLIFEGKLEVQLIYPLPKQWAKENDYQKTLNKKPLGYALILGSDGNSKLYVPNYLIDKKSGLKIPQYFDDSLNKVCVSLEEVKELPLFGASSDSEDLNENSYKKTQLLKKNVTLLKLEEFYINLKPALTPRSQYIKARFEGMDFHEDHSDFTLLLEDNIERLLNKNSSELIEKLSEVYNTSSKVFCVKKIKKTL